MCNREMKGRWEEVDKQVMSGRGDIIEIEFEEKMRVGGKIGFKEENDRSIEAIFGKKKRGEGLIGDMRGRKKSDVR